MSGAILSKKLHEVGEADGRRGTQVSFLSDHEIFGNLDYDRNTLENRLRELAFLNENIHITLTDERSGTPETTELGNKGGLQSFVRHVDRFREPLFPDPITVRGEHEESSSKPPCGGIAATRKTFSASPTTFRNATEAHIWPDSAIR